MHTPVSTEHQKHIERAAKAGSRIAFVLVGLIVLTVALIVWQYFGMEKVLELSPTNGRVAEMVAIDDRAQQGDSVAKLPAQGTMTIPVSIVRIARWWTDVRKTPLLNTETRIDNVTAIDLVIGSAHTAGHHRMTLRSLKFHGKLIRQNRLLRLSMASV